MNKRPLSKRKIKKTLNKVLFLSVLFFITLGILIVSYIIHSLKKNPIISPVSQEKITSNKNLPAISQNEAIKIFLEEQNISVTKTESATDSSTLVTLENGAEVLFSQKKDLQKQIASLQLIIRQLTIEGRQFKRIDLRYDNPVIVF